MATTLEANQVEQFIRNMKIPGTCTDDERDGTTTETKLRSIIRVLDFRDVDDVAVQMQLQEPMPVWISVLTCEDLTAMTRALHVADHDSLKIECMRWHIMMHVNWHSVFFSRKENQNVDGFFRHIGVQSSSSLPSSSSPFKVNASQSSPDEKERKGERGDKGPIKKLAACLISDLLEIVMRSNSMIAGSAAMAMYLVKEKLPSFSPSDVDVWVSHDDENTSWEMFIDWAEKEAETEIKNVWLSKVPHFSVQDLEGTNYTRLEDIVSHIVSFNLCGIPIQLLHLRKGVTKAMVVDGFDLTVCQASYDRENGLIATERASADVRSNQMHLTQDGLNQSWREWFRTLKRVYKYMKRGFTIANVDEVKKALHIAWEKHLDDFFSEVEALDGWVRVQQVMSEYGISVLMDDTLGSKIQKLSEAAK